MKSDFADMTDSMKRLFESGKIGVLISVIKSKKFTVLPLQCRSSQGKIETSQLQHIVGAKVTVSKRSDKSIGNYFPG